MKRKIKNIAFLVAIIALATSNVCLFRMNADLRDRVETIDSCQTRINTLQSQKNSRYENAIGFFKLATGLLNIGADVRVGIIDYYTKGDTMNAYDINGKYPDDYIKDFNDGKVGTFFSRIY